jgi:hypothetical protein
LLVLKGYGAAKRVRYAAQVQLRHGRRGHCGTL